MKKVPNILTVIRLLMIPSFIYAYLHPDMVLPGKLFSATIFVTASLTDLLDGYIARKYHAITAFGKLADPVADKVMVLSALCCLYFDGVISWIFLLLIFVKEALMIIGAYVMLKNHIVVYSDMMGKVATFTFMVAISMSFIENIEPWNEYVLYLGLFLTFCALINYTIKAIRQLKGEHEFDSGDEEESKNGRKEN